LLFLIAFLPIASYADKPSIWWV